MYLQLYPASCFESFQVVIQGKGTPAELAELLKCAQRTGYQGQPDKQRSRDRTLARRESTQGHSQKPVEGFPKAA